jgi:tetratricopeptide (TPR) repeat protein
MAYEQDGGPALAPNLIEALRRAFRAHAAGELREAEFGCRLVLAANKKQFEALHLLGLIEFQRGKLEEAERLIRQALRINPRSVQAHTNLGSVLQQRGRHQDALASLDRALEFDPANVLALSNRGNVLWRLKRLEEALASLDRALALKPDYVDALCTRGNVQVELKRLDEALESYDNALQIEPKDALVLHNRGNVLWALQRRDEALQSYDRAMALSPDDLSLLKDRGIALSFLQRNEEALASFDRALALKPGDPYLLYKRGGALADAGRHEEALDCFDQAFAIEPNDADALDDRGNVLAALQRHAEALASYNQALAIAPESAKAHWNRGLTLLRVGDFEHGWKEYEWRLKLETSSTGRRQFAQPRWLGEQPIDGKTVLLYSEQGFGDTLQFARYVPLVAALGATVILEVQPALKGLLAGLDGVAVVLGQGEELPRFDVHCPLMSLPLAFKTRLETVPAKTPYLFASEERVSAWKERLPESPLPRVGICWAGNPGFPADRPRTVGLKPILPLLSVPGAEFISVQKELRPGDEELLRHHPQLVHIGDKLEDFGDTAAVMSLLDLVISSDTSPAHLAGALSRPVWVLLQHTPDWRWLLARNDNPWYPSARLFRQVKEGDWEGAVSRLAEELKVWLGQECG